MDFIDDVKILNYIKEIEKSKAKGVHSINPPNNKQQEERSKQEQRYPERKRTIRTFNKMYCEKGENKISELREKTNELGTQEIIDLMRFKSNQRIVKMIKEQQEREM